MYIDQGGVGDGPVGVRRKAIKSRMYGIGIGSNHSSLCFARSIESTLNQINTDLVRAPNARTLHRHTHS